MSATTTTATTDDKNHVQDDVWRVEKILKSRVRNGKLQHLIKWRGFGPKYNSWEPDENVTDPALAPLNEREYDDEKEEKKEKQPPKKRVKKKVEEEEEKMDSKPTPPVKRGPGRPPKNPPRVSSPSSIKPEVAEEQPERAEPPIRRTKRLSKFDRETANMIARAVEIEALGQVITFIEFREM